jgi:hypothetical protein
MYDIINLSNPIIKFGKLTKKHVSKCFLHNLQAYMQLYKHLPSTSIKFIAHPTTLYASLNLVTFFLTFAQAYLEYK